MSQLEPAPSAELPIQPESPQVTGATATFADLERMVEEGKASSEQGAETQPSSDQTQPQQAQTPDGQAAGDPFSEALTKKGFKAPEDLLKSYEEAHATITKLSQERSKLAQDMEVLMQIQNAYAQANQPGNVQTPDGQGGFDEELYKEIAPKVRQDVAREVEQRVEAKLHEIVLKSKVEQKMKENPEEFNDLNPIMLNLLKQYPQVGALPNGFEMVYEKAKEVRKQNVNRMVKGIFGDNIDLDKMRAFFASQGQNQGQTQPTETQTQTTNQDLARSAYLPAGSASSANAQVNQKPEDYQAQIKGYLDPNRKMQRDDPDKVLDLWWKNVNAQSQAR
jgi:hypothetical protein